MRILIILLFISFTSFGQIIIDKKNTDPRIDISKFEEETISVRGTKKKFSIYYGSKNKRGKDEPFKLSKNAQVYDGDKLISLTTLNEVISYLKKWGYDFVDSDTKNYSVNGQIYNYTISRFVNNKFSKNSNSSAKDNAVKELKQLKELLDLGIVTQEEFDKKSEELKKIILGN